MCLHDIVCLCTYVCVHGCACVYMCMYVYVYMISAFSLACQLDSPMEWFMHHFACVALRVHEMFSQFKC